MGKQQSPLGGGTTPLGRGGAGVCGMDGRHGGTGRFAAGQKTRRRVRSAAASVRPCPHTPMHPSPTPASSCRPRRAGWRGMRRRQAAASLALCSPHPTAALVVTPHNLPPVLTHTTPHPPRRTARARRCRPLSSCMEGNGGGLEPGRGAIAAEPDWPPERQRHPTPTAPPLLPLHPPPPVNTAPPAFNGHPPHRFPATQPRLAPAARGPARRRRSRVARTRSRLARRLAGHARRGQPGAPRGRARGCARLAAAGGKVRGLLSAAF